MSLALHYLWKMYVTGQGPRLQNDLYCVEWDVKLYYAMPDHIGFCHTLVHLCCYYSEHWFFTDDKVQFMDVNSYVMREGLRTHAHSFVHFMAFALHTLQSNFSPQVRWHQRNKSLFPNVTTLRPPQCIRQPHPVSATTLCTRKAQTFHISLCLNK